MGVFADDRELLVGLVNSKRSIACLVKSFLSISNSPSKRGLLERRRSIVLRPFGAK